MVYVNVHSMLLSGSRWSAKAGFGASSLGKLFAVSGPRAAKSRRRGLVIDGWGVPSLPRRWMTAKDISRI